MNRDGASSDSVGLKRSRVIDTNTQERSPITSQSSTGSGETIAIMKCLCGFTEDFARPIHRQSDESFSVWYHPTRNENGEIECHGHNNIGQHVFTSVKAPKRPKWGQNGENI